ncbi:MAG: M23 family metallopeptidase [Flavobacteriales bacterium]|nr:M23 family metallopeptidase [Flavobacteriales bacterium]MBP9078756.1 M23 family metallopeptidase [Flavobacteriales bacterium]
MATSPIPESEQRKRRRKQLLRKLRNKYRAVLINESTYEERFSFRLSRMNVILLAVLLFVINALFVAAVIVFTPLKQYIPGYSDQQVKMNAYRAMVKADSLDQVLAVRDAYLTNLRNVLSGAMPADSASLAVPTTTTPSPADLKSSAADSILRARIRKEEAYSVHGTVTGATAERVGLPGLLFYPPLRGVVTNAFDPSQGHFGVDIVAKADEAVMACLDGTVILASWTSDAGHVMAVQHNLGLVSVYKHNAVLLRKAGDLVKAGEAIAIIGNSGELTTGPHLHFELWSGGKAVDPRTHIGFN